MYKSLSFLSFFVFFFCFFLATNVPNVKVQTVTCDYCLCFTLMNIYCCSTIDRGKAPRPYSFDHCCLTFLVRHQIKEKIANQTIKLT